MTPALADVPLTPAQVRLIQLVTYIQISRDHCGYLIDVDVLQSVAARSEINFTSEAERKARDEGFAAAEQAFAGIRGPVECAYALQNYGLAGTGFKGLIERRKQ